MTVSPLFPGILFCGDTTYNLYMVDINNRATPQSTQLSYGRLTAPPAIYGPNAIFGEGATQGTTILHAFNADGCADLWSASPIHLSCSVDATPAISDALVLYIAGSDGFLRAFDITNVASPSLLWSADVMKLATGTFKTISAVILSNDQTQVFLVTAAGLYGMVLGARGAPATALWSAQVGVDFSSLPPIYNNTTIYAAASAQLYAFDTSATPVNSVLPTLWSIGLPSAPTGLINLDCQRLLVGLNNGTLQILDMATDQTVTSITTGWSPTQIQNFAVLNNQVVCVSNSQLSAYTLRVPDVFPAGLDLTFPAVTVASGTLVGAPFLTETAIFVVSSTGSLYAYDWTGVQLWSQSLGSAGALVGFAFGAAQPPTTGAVNFLLDGGEYFPAMRDLLTAVKNNSLTDGSNPASPADFRNCVTAAATTGNKVYVLMWNTTLMDYVKDNIPDTPGALATLVSDQAAQARYPNARTQGVLSGQPNISVYMEPYPFASFNIIELKRMLYGDIGMLSQHQKISIFSINGTKLAMVSGMNIGEVDFDVKEHPMDEVNAAGDITYNGRHDTAILVTGDAANLVEAEFDRRWSKSGASSTSPGTTSYAKIACWSIEQSTCLDRPCACTGACTPTPFQNPTPSGPTVPLQVLVTNADDPTKPIRQIRQQLVTQINVASNYIYMENFTFHDVGLLQALVSKLSSTTNTCRVIIALPAPPGGESIQRPLIRAAMAILILMSGEWSSLTYTAAPAPVVITPSTVSDISVQYYDGVYRSTVTYTNSSNQQITFLVTDIISIVENGYAQASKLILCAPARYVSSPQVGNTASVMNGLSNNYRGMYIHSKLALFDDKYAVIGSANLNGRSMLWDGEMSVLVNDPATATAIRTRLFSHWGMSTAANWTADMQAFSTTTQNGVGMVRLLYSAFPPGWPRKFLSYLFDYFYFDPSQLL